MPPIRLLFVDDEPSLRLTLPEILRQHNFEVTSAATVAEGLKEINSSKFDVLVADLNVGEPGDGFTVVSAMRRTQPDCVNLILTGFPAFETALEAIRSQVDDYLVKPCEAETLVSTIEQKLRSPSPRRRIPAKRLATFLHDHMESIRTRTLALMKSHRKLGALPLSDEERVDHIPELLKYVVRTIESGNGDSLSEQSRALAAAHGRARRRHGYTIAMIVDDTRVLEQAIYDLVQEGLLELDLSHLITDLRKLNDSLENKLQESLNAYLEQKAA
ncbi:MAG: response regulator [Terriglobales bacterium]